MYFIRSQRLKSTTFQKTFDFDHCTTIAAEYLTGKKVVFVISPNFVDKSKYSHYAKYSEVDTGTRTGPTSTFLVTSKRKSPSALDAEIVVQ